MARLFNFKVMEPAPIEHLSILRAKSGSDVDREIYAFKDKGGRDVGLRFDLTVGMTRYVCARRELRPPVKLAAIAGAWRYDEPQHARYRWFKQWDAEIFGPPSVEADAEVIEATYRLLQRLGLNFSIQVGDRSAVQRFVNYSLGIKEEERAAELMRALDKSQKKSFSALSKEYEQKGFKVEDLKKLFDFGSVSGPTEKVLGRLGEMKVEASELAQVGDALKQRGVGSLAFNMSIVRGIDYYTGVVFEVVDEAHKDLGSLAGGGRYDLLPRMFGRPELSATGAAGGMERIAMSMSGLAGKRPRLVYVAVAGPKAQGWAREVLQELRANGIACESALQPRALSKQLEDADRAGASWAAIVGDKEAASGSVTLKDMRKGGEARLSLADSVQRLTSP